MASTITFNGSTYSIPIDGDSGWGSDLSSYLIAIASGALQKTGGNFSLTTEVDFGATYGAKLAYTKSQALNPASSGIIRLGNNESIKWRNAANNADLDLTVNASNALQFNANSFIFSGLGSIVNADINSSAAIAYSKLSLSNSIVNADVSTSAAIAYSKLAVLTLGRALQSNASTGLVEVSAVTNTELGYLSGVSSSIQTQLAAKQDSSTATTLTGTQTLTNKTLTSPTINTPTVDIETYTDQSSTPSNPAVGKRKLYSKTDGKFYQLDSAGVETQIGSSGSGLVPAGSVIAFAGVSAPSGYLMCDGSAVSRSSYSDLFAAIGIFHGQGNGTTTFNLPDYRGRFLRGVDGAQGRDPDRASRTAMNTGGNTGDNVGSLQGHAFQTHTHIQDQHRHSFIVGNGSDSASGNPRGLQPNSTYTSFTDYQTPTNQNASATGTHAQPTANETRPVNANVNWIIKF